MSCYLHQIPGRMRVRTPEVITNWPKAAAAPFILKRLAGVQDVQINQLTGSILIHYDSGKISAEDILEVLVNRKYIPFDVPNQAYTFSYARLLPLVAGEVLRNRSRSAFETRSEILILILLFRGLQRLAVS